MLTQQYELARIQEAKDVPVVRVIDAPGIPEKKSFPPRAIFCFCSPALIVIGPRRSTSLSRAVESVLSAARSAEEAGGTDHRRSG